MALVFILSNKKYQELLKKKVDDICKDNLPEKLRFIFDNVDNKKIISTSRKLPIKKNNSEIKEIIDNYIKELPKADTEIKSFFLRKKTLDILNKRDDFISNLIKVHIYYSSANVMKANLILNDLLNGDPLDNMLKYNLIHLSNIDLDTYIDNILKLTNIIIPLLNNEILGRLLKTIVKLNIPNRSKFYERNAENNWAINEIRIESLKSIYENNYQNAWFLLHTLRTTQNENNEYFNKYFNKRFIQNSSISYLWPLGEMNLNNMVLSNLVVDKALKDNNEHIIMELMENAELAKIIKDRNHSYKKAFFSIKRNYYKKLLENRELELYSFYKLIEIGDKSFDYIWLVLLR